MAESATPVAPKMKYKNLGKTGLKVSEICLGAMNFGWTTDEETSYKILDRFAELGGNFIDTANIYGKGKSESLVGQWLSSKKREDWVIASKVRFAMGNGPNQSGAGRKHIMASVEESLKRLQTSYIDLFQIHGYDKETPLEETLKTLNDLVRSGKVRYIGVSNYRGHQLQKAHYICKELGIEEYVCLQPQYNLLCRGLEWDVLEAAQDIGMGVLPWSPLKGGWLSGKYSRDMQEPPKDSRVAWASGVGFSETDWASNANEFTWNVLDAVKEIAAKLNKSQSQVALRWLMQKPCVTAPIVGPGNLKQAEDNFQIFDWSISKEDMEKLDKVSLPKAPYPYSWTSTSSFN